MLQRNFYILCFIVGGLSIASFAQRAPTTVTEFNLEPKVNIAAIANEKGKVTAVFAGGCFWGMEAVFENLKGVSNVVSGYSGGSAKSAHYEIVSSGQTEHAESIKVTFDPSQISYE